MGEMERFSWILSNRWYVPGCKVIELEKGLATRNKEKKEGEF